MDLCFTPEQEEFRREVRAFVESAMPPDMKERMEVDGHFEIRSNPLQARFAR